MKCPDCGRKECCGSIMHLQIEELININHKMIESFKQILPYLNLSEFEYVIIKDIINIAEEKIKEIQNV